MDPFLDALSEVRRVAAALTGLGIDYALGGSMASSLLGVPRFTRDADLMVAPFAGREPALAGHFETGYYVSVPDMIVANRERRSCNIINITSGFKIDLFVLKDREFDRTALARRESTPLAGKPDETLNVLTAEDVVLLKLEWYRLGDETSDRQWSDIVGLLKVRAKQIDSGYLRRWSAPLGVSDLLDRALGDSAS